MADRDVPRWLDQTADLMNSLKPDLIIGGGDFVHDGFGASGRTMEVRWRIAEAFLRRLKTRMEPVIGNHDFYEPLLEDGSPGASDPRWRFRKQFGLDRTYRSFEFRGHRFLILDSIKVVGGANPYRGWIDAAQLAWLDLEIQKIPRNQPIILCSHIPFRTSALDSFGELLAPVSGRVRVLNADVVMEKLKDRHVALILQGHVHLNELLSWSGTTPCITGGAVCGKWWRGSNFGTSPGVGLIEISYQSPEWNYMETPRPPDRGAKGVS
jgi:3',5'-cyclic AMP phosphodiesterase CpdA